MTELKEVISYLVSKYPHKDELSNARLTKMIYLADWRHAITQGNQITDIRWFFDNYGPFVKDVKEEALRHPDLFSISRSSNMFGNSKTLVSGKTINNGLSLQQSVKAALDHVVSATQDLSWNSFIKLVYGTYPVANSSRYSHLDLVSMAVEYRKTPFFATA